MKVDRVEWLWIADTQTQIDALTKGEIDYIEAPPHDLLPLLQKDPNVELLATNPYGRQYAFRFNTLHKPFDNPKIRQAVAYALNGKDFLDASIGDPKWYRECKSLFPCGSPLESTAGWDDKLSGNAAKARQLLQEAGYDGTPIVLMQQTDIAVLKDSAPVAKQLLEKAGFKVDLQSMDWQTLVSRRAKKDPPSAGGWHAFVTTWSSAEVLDPVSTSYLNASCDKATFGWPCDAEIERLRDAFAKETDPQSRRRSPRPCSAAPPRRRRTSISANTSPRWRTGRASRACWSRRTSTSGTSRSDERSVARPPLPKGEVESRGRARPGEGRAALRRERNPSPGRPSARLDLSPSGEVEQAMLSYILRRLAATVPVMLIVAVLVFLMLRLTPGDPAAIIAGDNANTEQVALIRSRLGLDRPMFVQFFIWLGNILQGDFGESFFFKKTVAELILGRLEPTAALALFTIVIAVLVAVPLGVLAAYKQGTWIDRIVMGFSVMGFSVPVFVIGYALIYLFAIKLSWVPVQGYQPIAAGFGGFIQRLILPSVTLAVIYIALIARMTRASVLEVLGEDYIRTARAKGQVEIKILFRHALKNAAVPIVTVIGLGVALLIGGVVVTESVYTIPGLGRLTVDAVLARDYPTIQAVILLFSLTYVLINLAVDLIYTLFDPRIRY